MRQSSFITLHQGITQNRWWIKNNVITHKVALTDKIEKVVRTWKTKRACLTTNKYKSKQGMKAIGEEAKELE